MAHMPAITWGALDHNVIDDLFAAELEELHLADRYEVHRVLGQGGQGTVYLAKDQHLGREVAIKCAHEQTITAEVALLSSLAHPGIPQLYDRGVAIDGTHYMVMQYIEGQRLDHYIASVKPNFAQRLKLFCRIASAIDQAHQQGIVHRDLKPSNILVNEKGHATIIDWGLAAKGDPRSVCGSPHFAAPEQLDGQPADHRADIFALGVLLYFICSGELPYARRVTDFNEFRAVRAGLRRVPLRQVSADAPKMLDKISQRAMAPQAGARYQHVQSMLAALDQQSADVQKADQSRMRRILGPMLLLGFCATAILGGMLLQQHGYTMFESLDQGQHSTEGIDFVGPPTPDEINWDRDYGKTDSVVSPPVTEDKKPAVETKPQEEHADPQLKNPDPGLPSLHEIMGEPDNFDEIDLDQ